MGILDNKVALVTGAAGGVGRGIALALAGEGASIAVVDIDTEGAAETMRQVTARGAQAVAIECDIRRSEQVNRAVAECVQTLGGVNILVNNAIAAHINVPIEQLADEDIDLSFDTGPRASLYFMRACFEHLKGDGRVINLRSASEIQGIPGMAPYIASKGAVAALTRAAAREWGRQGITVNCIAPLVNTEASNEHFGGLTEEQLEKFVFRSLSIPRFGEAEQDIGRTAVFLSGPDAAYITGCTLSVDGGGSFMS